MDTVCKQRLIVSVYLPTRCIFCYEMTIIPTKDWFRGTVDDDHSEEVSWCSETKNDTVSKTWFCHTWFWYIVTGNKDVVLKTICVFVMWYNMRKSLFLCMTLTLRAGCSTYNNDWACDISDNRYTQHAAV